MNISVSEMKDWLLKTIKDEQGFNEAMDQDDYSQTLGRITAYKNCISYLEMKENK